MYPLIFQTIPTFWLIFAIASSTAIYFIVKLSINFNLKLQFFNDNFFKLFIFSLLGARIFAIIANYQSYFYEFSFTAFFKLFSIWDKGLNIWGALIAFFMILFIACHKQEQNFWKWIDAIIPPIILAIAIGSIGAFFDGMNYGSETTLPWGVNFESPQIRYTVPIHPTQIYAFIYAATIGALLIIISVNSNIKEKKLEGIIGLSGITSYSFFYFLEQFVRGDDTWIILETRIPQIISLLIFISTSIFLHLRYNNPRNKTKTIKK